MRRNLLILLLLIGGAAFGQTRTTKQKVPITVVVSYEPQPAEWNRVRTELFAEIKKALKDSLGNMKTVEPKKEIIFPLADSKGKVFQITGAVRDSEKLYRRDGGILWKTTPQVKGDYTITLAGKITLAVAQDALLADYLKQ